MIIGNNQQGTVRDNINRMKGEKVDNSQGHLGDLFRNDEFVQKLPKDENPLINAPVRDDKELDYEDEKDWKDFY